MIQDLEKEVQDIWYHLRGNGEVGLLEQTRRNTETLNELKEDLKSVKKAVYDLKDQRMINEAQVKGMRKAFSITIALLVFLGGSGGVMVVRLFTDIMNAVQ